MVGSPIQWKEENVYLIKIMAFLGLSEVQMAHYLGVHPRTMEKWKQNRPEFLEALKDGRTGMLMKVSESLFMCAMGYPYEEEVLDKKGNVVTLRKYKARDPYACVKLLEYKAREFGWMSQTKVELMQNNISIGNISVALQNNLPVELLEAIEDLQRKQVPENTSDVGNN